MADATNQRRLAAILAADVAGYTKLVEQDTDGTVAAWKTARDDVIKPLVAEKSGHIIKFTGDGFLVEFPSVQDAVACAISMQEKLKSSSLNFRIGINVGDITDDGGDVHGEGVNIAARLEALAEPGGICITGDVHSQVRNRIKATFTDLGEQEVKHVSHPVRVYSVNEAVGREKKPITSETYVSDKPSIAVLPFDNMSGEPEQSYFSDGIAEDIITDLSKISSLFVIARNTTFTYKGKAIDVVQVALDLGVRYVLEGSVRKAGERVRINAQLIDGSTGGHVWADRFDRDLSDIFAVQDEVTGSIVDALQLHLTPQEQVLMRVHGTDNIEAYDLVLRARALIPYISYKDSRDARQFYEEAAKLDPNYSAIYSGIAMTLYNDFINGWIGANENTLRLGKQMALKSVALNPDGADEHFALAVGYQWEKDLGRAEIEINKAIQLDPNYSKGYATRGNIEGYAGRQDEAIEDLEYSILLDPEFPKIHLHFLAQAYFLKGEFEKAAELLERRIRFDPGTDISRILLAACFSYLGRLDEARQTWSEAIDINPNYSLDQKGETLPFKDPADWRKIVDGLAKAGLP